MRLGTRGSKLALIQTGFVKEALEQADPGLKVEVVVVTTTGDLQSGQKVADKKAWIEELEHQIISGDIDAAVHSAKDVPADIHPDTEVCSALERANPFDVVISSGGEKSLLDFSDGVVIGTSSLRRKAQLKLVRPDLEVVSLRGNVPTRIEKCLERGECDAMVIARAGVERLGLEKYISFTISAEHMVPAACQGTIALQFLRGDNRFKFLREQKTENAFQTERQIVEALGADCSSALGVYCSFENELFVRDCTNGLKEYRGEVDVERALSSLSN